MAIALFGSTLAAATQPASAEQEDAIPAASASPAAPASPAPPAPPEPPPSLPPPASPASPASPARPAPPPRVSPAPPAPPAPPAAPASSALVPPTGSELDLFKLDAILNETVVTASGGEEEEKSLASASVYTITREEILVHGWRSLAEALATVPGLFLIDDLVLPSVSVRGVTGGLSAGTRTVKVMIDGNVVNFRPDLTAFLGPEFIPIDAVERIEVAKGPLSALYGANAFLATVNVITRTPRPGLSADLSASMPIVRSPGFGGSLLVSYRGDNVWMLGAVSGERTDRSGVQLQPTFPDQTLDPLLFQRASANDLATPVSALLQLGATSERLGTLTFQGGLQRLDSIGDFRLNSLLTDKSRIVINNLWTSLRYEKRWARGGLTLQAGYSAGSPDRDYQLLLTNNATSSFRPNYAYQSFTTNAEGAYAPLGERLALKLGLDFEFNREDVLFYSQTFNQAVGMRMSGDTIDLIGPDDARQQDYNGVGAYLQVTSAPTPKLPGLRLTGNLRVDKIYFGPTEFAPQVSWRAAVAYRWNPRIVTKLFGGRAFQTPPGTLLFGHGGFGNTFNVIGDLNVAGQIPLRPQTIDSVEIATSLTLFKHLALEGGAYYQRISDEIAFIQRGQDFVATNRGTNDSVGFEAISRLSFGRFSAFLWASFIWSINGELSSNPPQGYATIIGASGFDIDVPEIYLHINALGRLVGPRGPSQSNIYLNNSMTYDLPTYGTLDVTLSTKPLHLLGSQAETRFLASGRNLIGTTWSEPGSGGFDIPNLGRTFFLQVKQSF